MIIKKGLYVNICERKLRIHGLFSAITLLIVLTQAAAALPDLIVTNISFTPSSGTVNSDDYVIINASIKNIGTSNTSAQSYIYVMFLIDNISYTYSYKYIILEPGDSSYVTTSWYADPLKHNVTAIVDQYYGYSYIPELNESNNSLTVNFPFQLTGPDLIVTDITTNPSPCKEGESTALQAAIKNIGTGVSNSGFYVRFYIDNVSVSDIYSYSTLTAGGQTNITYPWIAARGVHNITVLADSLNYIKEINETNNTMTKFISGLEGPTFNEINITPPFPNLNTEVTIKANITDDKAVNSVKLNYSVNGIKYSVTMSRSGDIFTAIIPGQPNTTTIDFYINATDSDGVTLSSGKITFIADGTPPVFSHYSLYPQYPIANQSVSVGATIYDNVGINNGTLFYRFGESSWNQVPYIPTLIKVPESQQNTGLMTLPADYLYWDIQSDGSIGDGGNDAYDGMYHLNINGSSYYGSPNLWEANGREIVFSKYAADQLQASRKIYAPQHGYWARYIDTIYNPTNSDIEALIQVYGNLGSDSSTNIWADESYWLGTDDYDSGGDPSLSHVFGSINSNITRNGDNICINYRVNVPSKQAVSLITFAVKTPNQSYTRNISEDISNRFENENTEYSAFMSPEESSQILNWNMAWGHAVIPPTVTANLVQFYSSAYDLSGNYNTSAINSYFTTLTGEYPDLVVTGITIWNATDGGAGSIMASIKNNGTANVTNPFLVRIERNGTLVGSQEIDSLLTGESKTVNVTWSNIPAGISTIKAIADGASQISESNETNNQYSILTSVGYPDYIISSIEWTPVNFSQGDLVRINATVYNVGNVTHRNSYVRIDMDDYNLYYQYISGIDAGGSLTVSTTWIANAGSHNITAFADGYYNYISESNESNNSLKVALPYSPPADLTITDLTWSPTTFNSNELVTFNATIKNIGEGNFNGVFYVGFYIDDLYIGYGYVNTPLHINESVTVTRTWSATSGNHTVKVKADDYYGYGSIQESNESNNEMIKDLPHSAASDLIVQNVSWSPVTFNAGRTVTFNATIKNIGEIAVASSWYVGFYIDGGYVNYGYVNSLLGAGNTISVESNWTATGGDHNLKVVADVYNEINEQNEDNNTLTAALPSIPLPDLEVTNITWTPQDIEAGKYTGINATIKNTGAGDIAGIIYAALYIDDNYITSGYTQKPIPVGGTAYIKIDWMAQPGSHSYKVKVDPWNYIPESSDINNELSGSLPYIPYPDLIISNLSWSPNTGIKDGDPVNFNMTISNIGEGRAGAFYSTIEIGGMKLYSYIPELPAGGSTMFSLPWSAVPLVNATVVAAADSYDYILESDETNNTRSAALENVAPVERFNVNIWPYSNTIGPGGNKIYSIRVNNYGSAAGKYNLNISGLNKSWYTLEKETVFLDPGEIAEIHVNVTLDQNCYSGASPILFTAKITSNDTGANQSIQGQLIVDPGHSINNLLPPDGNRLGSTNVSVSWDTFSNATAEVFYRNVNSTDFILIKGESGFHHAVIIPDLLRNTKYEYYVRSNTSCGTSMSGVKSFFVDNGISFVQKSYTFNIERDYDQRIYMTVVNTDSKSHKLLVQLTKPYEDLIGNFVGSGSEDEIITLAPGESRSITLALFAQDALLKTYTLGLNLTNIENNTEENLHDYATAVVNVHHPYFNFTIDEISSDNLTLKKKFRITNNGDPITDLRAGTDEANKSKLYFEPSITHGYLPGGGSMEFEAIPVLAAGMTGFSVPIVAEGAGKQVNVTANFFTPPGEKIFIGMTPPMDITFTEQFDNDGINYTNPPEGVVLSPFRINTTLSVIAKVSVMVKQFDKPVSGANVSFVLTYKGASTNVTTIYGKSNLFGVASFTIYGPPGNYSYEARLAGYDKNTETRNFSVSENAFKSFDPFTITWTNASDALGNYEINNSAPIYFDRPPLVIRAKKAGLKPDSRAEIYFKDVSGVTDFIANGKISGDEILFNISSVDAGEYSAVIMVMHQSEIFTSRQQTFVFSENSSDTDNINPDYETMLPIAVNGTDVDFIKMKHMTIDQDGNKLVRLYNIKPFNTTHTLFSYVMVVNQTMTDVMQFNVTDNSSLIYSETRSISFNEFEPEIVEIYVPLNMSITRSFNVSLLMEDRSWFSEWFTTESGGLFDKQVWVEFFSNNPLQANTRLGVAAACVGRFLPGLGTVMGWADIGYGIKDIAVTEGKEQFENSVKTSVAVAGKAIDPLIDRAKKPLLDGLIKGNGMITNAEYIKEVKKIKHLSKLSKIAGAIDVIGNVNSNVDDWNRVTKDQKTGGQTGINQEINISDWYCTNRPVIHSTFDIPYTVPQYLSDGTANIDYISIKPYYSLPYSPNEYQPHDVNILLNGNSFGELKNTIPTGDYLFSAGLDIPGYNIEGGICEEPGTMQNSFDISGINIEPALLNFGTGASSGKNTITTSTTHLNGGHYVVSTNMKVVIHYKVAKMPISAVNQTDADNKVKELVKQFTGKPDIILNQREISAPSKAAVGNPELINITIHNYGTQAASDIHVQLLDNGIPVENQSIFLLPLGGSHNLSFTWTPGSEGSHVLKLAADPLRIIQESNTGNNEGSVTVDVMTLERNPPVVEFVEPTPVNASLLFGDSIQISVLANETLNSVLLEWNGTNESMSGSDRNWTSSKTGIEHGTYWFRVWGRDISGNWNSTEIRIITFTALSQVKGDLNRNGRRDTGDATLMLRTIVELPIPSQYQPVLPVGDMNCNNRIDTGDATLVLRDVVNLPIPRCWE